MRIIQLVPGLYYGDAVGNDILAIDRCLKEAGYDTQIYAIDIDRRLTDIALYFKDITEPASDDIIIYHLAIANAMMEYVTSQKCIRVLRYHNVTPPAFYANYNMNVAMACQDGLREVKQAYDSFDFCIPDSEFNASDLKKYGYTCPMQVVPIVIPFKDYMQEIDADVYNKYNDGMTNILFVGRFAPNKKWEDVIGAYSLYKKYWNPNARLIMVGKYDEKDPYYLQLLDYIEEIGLPDIEFTGHISFKGILACYKASDLFVCMSEHEGFCVPLVEAMFFKKPILAYNSCAVPETMGVGTLVMTEKNLMEIAGMMNYVLSNEVFRMDLVRHQNDRLKDFSYEKISTQFLDVIKHLSNK